MHQLAAWYLEFKTWYLGSLAGGGYPLIVLLMAMESSIVPIPSEFVVPQAAYLAHVQGRLSPGGVLLAATLGSWLGASIMYGVSRFVGRPLIERYGRWFLISPAKLGQAERWSERFGMMGVFVARLLPVIRHLIGIPSGILRLDFIRYSLCTLAGSLLWCSVLTAAGVFAGNNPQDIHKISLGVVGAAMLLAGVYFAMSSRLSREPARGR